MANLPTTQSGLEAFHAGIQWADVATAFFAQGTSPSWTNEGKFTAEQLFASVAGKTITPVTLAEAFAVYASVAMTPGSATPVALTSPPGVPDFSKMLTLPAQVNHVPAADVLFNALLVWATQGTVLAVPTPTPWM